MSFYLSKQVVAEGGEREKEVKERKGKEVKERRKKSGVKKERRK